MRKNILGIAVMAAVAIAAAWNINQSENDIKLSDIALDNVEALASCETSVGGSCWWNNSSYSRCCEGSYYGCSPCE